MPMYMRSPDRVHDASGCPLGLLAPASALEAAVSATATWPPVVASTASSGVVTLRPVALIATESPFWRTADTRISPSCRLYSAPTGRFMIARMGSSRLAVSGTGLTTPLLRLTFTPCDCFRLAWLLASVWTDAFAEPQLSKHRTLAMVAAKRNSLDGPRKAVDGTLGAGLVVA